MPRVVTRGGTLVTPQPAAGRDVPGVLLSPRGSSRGSCCRQSQGSPQLSQSHWESHRDGGDGARGWQGRAVSPGSRTVSKDILTVTETLLQGYKDSFLHKKTKPTSSHGSIFQKGIIILICQPHLRGAQQCCLTLFHCSVSSALVLVLVHFSPRPG